MHYKNYNLQLEILITYYVLYSLGSTCLNGGTCINTVGSYKCQCNQYTNGTRCELDIDECALNSGMCQNDGHCRNLVFNGFDCLCRYGFSGK